MLTPQRWRCCWQEPSLIAKEIVRNWGEPGFIWLDGDGSPLGRWATLGMDPIDQVCCRGLPKKTGASNPFEALRNLEPGHWSGWLSYEAAAWVEFSDSWKPDAMATLWLAKYDPILRFDLAKHQLWIEGTNPKRMQSIANWLSSISTKEILSHKKTTPKSTKGIPLESWNQLKSRDEFAQDVKRIQQWITQGDIFQANLTACYINTIPKDLLNIDLFLKLKEHCNAPFSGLIVAAGPANGEAIISTSPERFLKTLPTGHVETRPIKGTRPRHPNPTKDAKSAADLICSAKDRAENIMIVDLLRNDLGRVCKPGSINVPQLVGLESFSHVHHLTSIVNGLLRADQTWVDLLQACWPGGSISGAPKLRACERLNELEHTPRGPYCGSILCTDWNGQIDSNILIRSLFRNGKTLRAHAGCGIVADSDPNNEADELNWKLLPLLKALE